MHAQLWTRQTSTLGGAARGFNTTERALVLLQPARLNHINDTWLGDDCGQQRTLQMACALGL